MSKQITYPYKGKDYTLEYTADTIKQMVRQGFKPDDIEEKPILALPNLFYGAFLAKHSNVSVEKREEMFKAEKHKKQLFPLLIEAFTDTYSSYLIGDDEDDEGNAAWTPNWKTEED